MAHLLKGRSVVVTGGFGILGRALAVYLLEQGARVAALDLSAVPVDIQASEDFLPLGGVDLTDPVSAGDAMAQVSSAFGQIDSLVNVAGGFAWEPFETISSHFGNHFKPFQVTSETISNHFKSF